MKIIMITHDTKIDRRILHEANSLIQKGNEVIIVACPWDGDKGEEYGKIEICRSINKNVERYNKPKTFKFYQRIKHALPSKLKTKIRKIYDSIVLDYEKHFEAHLLELTIEKKADVYHAHDLPSLSTAYKAARKHNAFLVYDSHEIFCEQGLSTSDKKKWSDIEKKYINEVNAVITINESAAKHLHNVYKCQKPVVIMNKERTFERVVYSDFEKNKLREALNIPMDKKILIYQGGIVEKRNIDSLVLSMNAVSENIILMLIGKGDYRKQLEKIVECKKLSQKVFFIDEVPQKELLKYTSIADVGLIPYMGDCLNNYYCTPNKLFEFIAAGVPIIANNLPEIEKVVLGENIGCCIDFSDINNVAEMINQLVGNDEILYVYKENLHKIQEKYSWEFEEQKLFEVYETLNEIK